MERVKIHFLIHVSLLISSLTMGNYAYQNFSAGQTGYGTVFLIICIFLIALVIYGVIRNQKIGQDQNFR